MAVDPVGGGTTTPSVGVHAEAQGSVVNITASPAVGYIFSGWTGSGVADSGDPTTTVLMDGDKTVTATFTPQTYDLTMAVAAGGGGATTPAVGGPYNYGASAVVDVVATPDPGYAFDSWTGDVADPGDPTTTVTMDADKTVTATFAESSPGSVTLDGAVSSGTADGVSYRQRRPTPPAPAPTGSCWWA